MIPCFICGQPAETDWVLGLPPAPDSQKLGLCREHNNVENRAKVNQAWQGYLKSAIGELNRTNAQRIQRIEGQPRLLSIFFTGGGSISVPCIEYSTPDPDVLKVLTSSGEFVFFPLRQVRHYTVGPLPEVGSTPNQQPVGKSILRNDLLNEADSTQSEQPLLNIEGQTARLALDGGEGKSGQ